MQAGLKQINATIVQPIDSVTLEATFDFSYVHQTGLYSVYVFNIYDGTQILENAFELLPGENSPSIVSVSPDTVRRGELLEIEVTTENFEFKQGTNLVNLEQGNDKMYFFKGMTVKDKNSLALNCLFNNNYPLGYYDLIISADYRGEMVIRRENALFVQPDLTMATIDSISVDEAMQGENITMFIYGTNTNFTKNDSENKIHLGNTMQNIWPFYINPVDSVTLEAHFQFTYNHLSGIYSIYVNNDYDGTQALTDAFELSGSPDYPAITSVTPDTIVQGQTLDIEVSAENIDFTQGTNVIRLIKDNTQFYMTLLNAVNPALLVGTVSVSEDAPVGNYNLSVWNSSFDITLNADQTIVKENAFYLKSGVVNNNDIKLSEENCYIFPNPVRDYLNLSEEADLFKIFNLDGRLLFEVNQTKNIDLTGLKPGTYIVKIEIGKMNYTHKLIKE